MFGLGYVGRRGPAVLHGRPAPRGPRQLSSFAGGANQGQDAEQWAVAPYTEADLERQVADLPKYLGAQGARIVKDAENYLAGVNQYILEAKLDPTKLPGEYAAIGRPLGPEPFKPADIIATAAMVGGIFGKGGGKELQFSLLADALESRFGKRDAARALRGLPRRRGPRGARDRLRAALPLPGAAASGRTGVARPDQGTLKLNATGTAGAVLPRLRRCAPPTRCWSPAAESASGHPLMVAGPQVGYFNPQILMEQGVHAPASRGRPGDRRPGRLVRRHQPLRPARPRARLRVERDLRRPGHHRHVRARALRRHALPLPRPLRADRGAREDQPLGADPGRPDQARLADAARRAHQARPRRRARARSRGKPVIFTKLRSTYFHEIDSAAGFMDFNTPEVVKDTASFQRAAAKIGYTFNWFYADAEHIAYFNSGANPVRAAASSHDFPVAAEHRVARLEPGHLAGALHALRAAPAGRRPGLPRQLEQQAGARPTAPPTTTPSPPTYRVRAARGPRQGADRGAEEDDAAAADRRDGGGRDHRPARRTSTCRWR